MSSITFRSLSRALSPMRWNIYERDTLEIAEPTSPAVRRRRLRLHWQILALPVKPRPLDAVKASPFFRLPAEIRNEIYRLSVVETVHVRSSGYETPALLKTCHALRNEAQGIFFSESKFVLPGYRYDSSVVLRASQTLLPILGSYRDRVEFTLDVPARDAPHWANLMLWLERFHANVLMVSFYDPMNDRVQTQLKSDQLLICGLFQTVSQMRKCRVLWAQTKVLLEQYRPALIRIDERWGD